MSSATAQYGLKDKEGQTIGELFGNQGLEWLARFITGDERVAAACIVDGCARTQSQNPIFEDWLGKWVRIATIRSAVNIQRSRIAQLSPVYLRCPCRHGGTPLWSRRRSN